MSANETTLLSKSQFVKVNHYRSNMSKYSLQHGALAPSDQQAIKGLKNDMCKTIQTRKPTV